VDDLHRIEEGHVPTPVNEHEFILTWKSDSALEVRCFSCENMKPARWKDVEISYIGTSSAQ
jgi:hypothetical protein